MGRRDFDRAGKQPKAKKSEVQAVLTDADVISMFKKGKVCENMNFTVVKPKGISAIDIIRNKDGQRLARIGRLGDKKCCWVHLDHPNLQHLMDICSPFKDFGSLFTDTYEPFLFRHFQEKYNELQERKLATRSDTLL